MCRLEDEASAIESACGKGYKPVFTITDGVEATLFLSLDNALDGFVLDRLQLHARRLSIVEGDSLLQKRLGSEKRTEVLCAEGRVTGEL